VRRITVVLLLGLVVPLLPTHSFASTRSDLEAALRDQRSLAAKLVPARRHLARVLTEVDRVVNTIQLRRLAVAVADDRLLLILTRRDPAIVDRLALARRAVERLALKKRAVDRRVAGLNARRQDELARLFQVCPVDAPRTYRSDFGVISLRGGRHVHQGIDIHASYGTPIRAPFSGRAEVAANGPGGLAVKVFGPLGFVYNAHLSGLGSLGPVRDGDVIGYVGASGNARGGAPHDHFEWHPGDGPAVNPFAYLNEAC
jgi:murein DD-endopeptidase MepM/ murein hydrolase activator NlpD